MTSNDALGLADELEATQAGLREIEIDLRVSSSERDLIVAALRRSPLAAPANGAGREAIAAYFLARDEDYAVTPHMMEWARTLIAAGLSREHSGDCTNESQACKRCIAERALEDADAILALASPVEGRAEWQPIETAPKDGTRLILAWDDSATLPMHWEVGRFRSGAGQGSGWCNTYGHSFGGNPTHWMIPNPPLNPPAPPNGETATDEALT